MAEFTPRTIGEALYWSYAGMAMAFAAARDDRDEFSQSDYIVRNKLFSDFMRGDARVQGFLLDEREKIFNGRHCAYCGSEDAMSLDHVVPRFENGPDAADNLIPACRSCNSSKGTKDMLVWYAGRGEFPTLVVLRRYLKLAIRYCVANQLMDYPLEWLPHSDVKLPFAVDLLPNRFPPLSEWIVRTWPGCFDEDDDGGPRDDESGHPES